MVCNDLTIELIFSIAALAPFSGVLGVLLYPPHTQHPKQTALFWCCVFLLVFFVVQVKLFLSQKSRVEERQVRSTLAFLGVPRLLVHFKDLLLHQPSWGRWSSTGNKWPWHATWTTGPIPPTGGATITTTFARKGTTSKITKERSLKPSLQGHWKHKISLKCLRISFWLGLHSGRERNNAHSFCLWSLWGEI